MGAHNLQLPQPTRRTTGDSEATTSSTISSPTGGFSPLSLSLSVQRQLTCSNYSIRLLTHTIRFSLVSYILVQLSDYLQVQSSELAIYTISVSASVEFLINSALLSSHPVRSISQQIQQFLVLSATDIPEYQLRTLKMLHGWMHHELTNPADRIAEAWPSDGQVYKASDYLSKPFQVACHSKVGAKLHIPIQRS